MRMMLDVTNPAVCWGYFGVAVIGSLAYGFVAPTIFGVVPKQTRWRIAWWHQFWFNSVGAAIGWIAGWAVIVRWLGCHAFVCKDEPGAWTIVLAAAAFVGVTGHLPFTRQSLREWAVKGKDKNPK